MTPKLTGHAEIDRQHAILEDLIEQFRRICRNDKPSPGTCNPCALRDRKACADDLADLADELLTFLVGHFTYEERLMDLLPAIPSCADHIAGHKNAHADISERLARVAARIPDEEPIEIGIQLHRIIRDWMGRHTSQFDLPLTDQMESAEIEFDSALVAILDEQVFLHRPAKRGRARRAEIAARVESLTPRQQEVCRLVASGMANKDIASRLGTTVNTIKTHRAEIFRKMEVASVLDLVRALDALRT
jgi:hemerythrin-like metal-binding protein